MTSLLPIYKPVGLTPLQLINRLRKEKPEYIDETIGYAGRLDPMADGLMLLMIGDETKNRDKYLSLTKIYEFTVLFGVETDTYDFLGLVKDDIARKLPDNANLIVNSFVKSKIGKSIQTYPPYSSKTVQGKPLFLWAKEGKLHEIELPKHAIEIKSLVLKEMNTISEKTLQKTILDTIALLKGDFRQQEIIDSWNAFFQKNPGYICMEATFEMHCSSGTYVRQLVHELGKEIGCGAITLSITRTKLGDYALKNALYLANSSSL